jgi:prophage tail gpP-like protein
VPDTEKGLPLAVKFERLGRETNRIGEWFIDSGFLTSTDVFQFQYVEPDDPTQLFGLEGQPVRLRVGECEQLVGRIDETDIGAEGAAIACDGRDYMADLVECGIDPLVTIKEGMTLQAAVALAASTCGVNLVLGDAAVMRNARSGRAAKSRGKAPKSFLKLQLKDLKPQPEQGIYDFINRLAARHGCTPQPTLNRNEINLVAPNYDQEPLYRLIRSRTQSGANRIKSARAKRSFARFPTYTIVRGQGTGSAESEKSPENTTFSKDTAVLNPETAAVSMPGRVKPAAHGADADGRLYRLLYVHDQTAQTKEQVGAAAFRAIYERMKDTLLYTATISGHADAESGAIWSVDTVVDVQDEVTGVREHLWIHSRKLGYSQKSGAETTIQCWRLGALQLGATE